MFRRIPLGLALIIICILLVAGCTTTPVLDNQTSIVNASVTPVTTQFITIDPIVNHTIGDVFFINGTTNLPVTENLTMAIEGIEFVKYISRTNTKSSGPPPLNEYRYISDISISPAQPGTNRWSTNVTDIIKELVSGKYEVFVCPNANYLYTTSGSTSESDAIEFFTLFPANNGTTFNVQQVPVQNPSPIQSTTIPGAPPKLSPEEEAKMREIMREQDRINELRKANRTFWQRKLSSQLLSLLESDSYIKTGKISEQDMKSIMTSSTVIPSDQVFQKLGISKPTGDLFLVELKINKSASTYNVYPYVASVSGTIGHTIYCWVELSSLQDIASLEPVIQIDLAYKPGLDVYVAGNPITNQALPNRTLENTTRNTSPSLTETATPVTLPRLSPEQEAKKQEILREQDRLNKIRKANRTFWQRKLSSQLLSLLESDSYIKTGKISEQDLKSIMISSTVIPSDQVFQKLGISKLTGDLFLVELRINKSASTYNVYPFVASVSGTIDRTIYCWVELSLSWRN